MSCIGLALDMNANTTPVRRGVKCFRRHRTRLDSRTRAIGRNPTSGREHLSYFYYLLKKLKKMLTKYEPFSFSCTFIFSLSFPISKPNASLATRRHLRFPMQVGPCLSCFFFLICSAAPFLSFSFVENGDKKYCFLVLLLVYCSLVCASLSRI